MDLPTVIYLTLIVNYIRVVYRHRNQWFKRNSLYVLFLILIKFPIAINTTYVSWKKILKAENNWYLINNVRYIVILCEINSKGIQFKKVIFSETCVHFNTKTCQADFSQIQGREGS